MFVFLINDCNQHYQIVMFGMGLYYFILHFNIFAKNHL
jgi:hypothetical protein